MSFGLELARAYLTVRGDTTMLKPDLDKAKPVVDQWLGSIGGKIKGVLAGVGVAVSIQGLIQNARQAIGEASRLVDAEMKLGAVLKSTGNVAQFTSEQLLGMANEMSKVTKFDSTTIIESMAALVPYGIKNEEMFRKITMAAMDASTIYGGTLRQSVQAFAQALADPVRGLGMLSRQGFKFNTEQRAMIKEYVKLGQVAKAQGVIWDVISGQEGAAMAVTNSHSGKVAGLRNRISDLREELGKRLLPVQQMFTEAQLHAQEVMNVIIGTTGDLIIKMGELNKKMLGFPTALAGVITLYTSLNKVLAINAELMSASVNASLAKQGITGLNIAYSNQEGLIKRLIQLRGAFLTGLRFGPYIAAAAAVALAIYGVIKWMSKMPEVQAANMRAGQRLREAWRNVAETFAKVGASIGKALLEIYQGALLLMGVDFKELPHTVGEAYADILDRTSTFVLEMSDTFRIMSDDWELVWQSIGKTASLHLNKIQLYFAEATAGLGRMMAMLDPTGMAGFKGFSKELQLQVEELQRKIKELETDMADDSLDYGKKDRAGQPGGRGDQKYRPEGGPDGGGTATGGGGMKAGMYGFEQLGSHIQGQLLDDKNGVPSLLKGITEGVAEVRDAVEELGDDVAAAGEGVEGAVGAAGAAGADAAGGDGASALTGPEAKRAAFEAEQQARRDANPEAEKRRQREAERRAARRGGEGPEENYMDRRARMFEEAKKKREEEQAQKDAERESSIQAGALGGAEYRNRVAGYSRPELGTGRHLLAPMPNPFLTPDEQAATRGRPAAPFGGARAPGYRTVRPGADTPTHSGSGIPGPIVDPFRTVEGMQEDQGTAVQRRLENERQRAAGIRALYAEKEAQLQQALKEVREGKKPSAQAGPMGIDQNKVPTLLEEQNTKMDQLITATRANKPQGLT